MIPLEARRFGDVYISLNSIVRIRLSLDSIGIITGRVERFEDSHMVLDTSNAYQSIVIDIRYADIVDIADVTIEEIFP